MSANCSYSEKFRPLVIMKFPSLMEGTFDTSDLNQKAALMELLSNLFTNPNDAYKSITGENFEKENPVETKDIDQRLNVLQNVKQGSIGTFYVANSNELAAVQRDFKKRLVECSIFSIDYSEDTPVWNWVENPNDIAIGEISQLNKNILDYKLELINLIRAALPSGTFPAITFDSSWTDSDFQKIVYDTIKAFESLKTDSSLSDVGFQKLFNAYALLVNFDEFIEEQVPFISVKKAYSKLEGLSKYEYRGPNVENYTGFHSGEFAAIENQDSDLAKIILDMIPECDAKTGEVLEATSCGLAGFNSGMTVIKRNLLHDPDLDLQSRYFSEGLEFDLQSFVENFIYASTIEKKNAAGAYDPNRTFLLNKLKGISTFLLSDTTPIAVKNMFMQMFIKTEAIAYRAYTRTDNGFAGKNLKSRFIDTQRGAVEGFIENGIRQFSKPIMKKLLDSFDLTDNKNGTWELKDGKGVSITFGITYEAGKNPIVTIDNQGINPKVINDLVQVVLQQIVPSEYETCIPHKDDWTFANDYLPLIAVVLNHINNYGTLSMTDDGKFDFKEINSLTIPVASRLSVVYGAETKNVVNSPSGKKLPLYQLTCLAYNVKSLIDDFSNVGGSDAYAKNLLVANKDLLGDPMVRNEILINGQSKEPSKLTVSELAQVSIIEDFFKELWNGSIYLQNATFADKGTHFLQEYRVNTVQVNDQFTLQGILQECALGNPNVDSIMLEFIRKQRADKVNKVVSNILKDYSTVYGRTFSSLEDLEEFFKAKPNPADILHDFNEYNKKNPNKPQVVFYEEIHSSGKNSGLNEMIKNHYKTFNDPKKTKERMDRNLQRFAETIYEEGFSLSGFSDRGTVDGIISKYSAMPEINNKFYNSITKKLKFVIKNPDGTYEIHPILKSYFYADVLLSNEYNSLAIGEAWCHPNKNKSANVSSLTKVISGGQTGVDQIGLKVAKALGIETGGTATPGFITETGQNLELNTEYGLVEISKELQGDKKGKQLYTPRTEENVKNSDGTVYFASDTSSAGLWATRKFAETHGKPFILNPTASQLQDWISKNKIKTLNIAGNRASKLKNPQEIENLLKRALSMDDYIEYSEASRLIAQIKRSVIFGATIHPYAQHVLDSRGVDIGVAENVRVAVLKDMGALARNYVGDEAENDSMDGSGYSHPIQARLENNSLIDNRVGYNKKSIHGDVDSKYGIQKLLKWAVYGITNEVRRNSKGSKASMEIMYKKMSDKTFTKSKNDITNGIIRSLNGQAIYFYDEDNGTIVKRDGWKNVAGDLQYTETIYKEVSNNDGTVKYVFSSTSGPLTTVPKNLYEVDQLFGGAWACEPVIEGASVKGPTFNEKNLDVLEDFVCVNKLKDHFIAYAVNKSAMKTGIGNMNGKDAWTDPNKALTTISMSTKYSGIQMDADHELDIAEVTEMTQMISALIEDGHYVELVEEIYDIIGKTVFEQLGDYKNAVDKKDLFNLYKILAKSLIESFEGDDKDTLGLAQAFVRKAQSHINDEKIEFVLPFSAQTINGAFIANLASTINKKGIRHKYQGFAGVLNPSYNAIQYFRVYNPNLREDGSKRPVGYEVRMYKEFMELTRSLGMKFADTQSNDPNVNKFLVQYKNGKFDIDFEDTVVIYNTDENGNIVSVAEEIYVNTYEKYDNLRHRYNWKNKVAYNKTSAPKNLKQANTRFEVEVNGERTVYSLYDTDSVRAQYYLSNLEKAIDDKEAFDIYETAFILSLVVDDPNIKTRLYDGEGKPIEETVTAEINALLGNKAKAVIKALRYKLQTNTQNFTKALDERTTIRIPSFNGGGFAVCLNAWTSAPEIIAGRYHGKQFGLTKNDHIFDIVKQGANFFYKKLSARYDTVSKDIFGDIFDVTLYHGDSNFAVKIASDEDVQKLIASLPEDAMVSEDTDFREIGDCYWYDNERVCKSKGIKFYRILRNGEILRFVTCADVETYTKFSHSHFFDQFKEYNWTAQNLETLKEIRFGKATTVRLYVEPTKANASTVAFVGKNELTLEQLLVNESRARTVRLKELAECQFESFKQQLNYVGARIPTQAMQSFMPMEIIAFTDTDKNEVYVPAAQTWLQGSDYDIDKLYILAHSIDDNGVLQMTSDLVRYYPISMVRELKQPNGVTYSEGENGYAIDYDTLTTIVKCKHGDDLKPGFSTEDKKIFIETLNDIFSKEGNTIKFVGFSEGEDPRRYEWMKNRFLQILNTHSQSKSTEMSSEDCLKNKIVASILKVTKNVQNQIASHMPIDMTEQQEAAAGSVMGEAAKHMCSDNPMAKYIMQTQNMIGKEVIGITAVGLKGFFGLSTYYGIQIENAAKSEDLITLDKDRILHGVPAIQKVDGEYYPVVANLNFEPLIEKAISQGNKPDSDVVKLLRKIQYRSRNRNIGTAQSPVWVPIDVALSISGLLSAATDNAKELILAKINATPELADIYIYLLTKGWTFGQIAKIMCSESFTFATKLGEKNIFNLGSTSYSVKKMIPFILKQKDLPGARLDLLGGLLKTSDKETIVKKLEDVTTVKSLIDLISTTLEHLDEKHKNMKRFNEDELEQYREQQEMMAEEMAYDNAENFDDGMPLKEQIKIKPLDLMYETDLITALGQLEVYLKRNQYLQSHSDLSSLTTINNILPAVAEMSLVGQTFGINQGVKTNIRDFLNFKDKIESAVNSRFMEFGKSLPGKTKKDKEIKEAWKNLKFDFLQFLNDEDYKESMIRNYEVAKINFNVLDAFATVPHFAEMLKAYGMTQGALSGVCSKFRVMSKINAELKERRIFATEKDFKEIGNYVNDLYISKFLKEYPITFNIPYGQVYYLDIFGKSRVNKKEGRTIRLNSAEGAATFKNWVENYVIPTLKTSKEFGSEEFIKSLCTYETKYMGNVISGYTLPLQMMEIDKSINTQRIFEGILRSFDSISMKTFENGMTLGEIFYLYNLIVNKDGFGQRSLTRIFENLINSRNFKDDNIINRYYQFIGNTDINIFDSKDPNADVDELIFRLNRYSSTFDEESDVTYERPNPDFTFDLPITTGWGGFNFVQNVRLYAQKEFKSTVNVSPEELIYSVAEGISDRYSGSVELVNNEDLNQMDIPEVAKDMNAFIYNGKVYVNIDSSNSISSALHEWAHLVFANMKFSSDQNMRNAYYAMLKKVANDSRLNDPEFMKFYEGFAQGSDLLEEVVTYHIASFLQNKINKKENVIIDEASILSSLAEIFGVPQEGEVFLQHMLNTDLNFEDVVGEICAKILSGNDTISENIVLLSQKVANLKKKLIEDGKLDIKCND